MQRKPLLIALTVVVIAALGLGAYLVTGGGAGGGTVAYEIKPTDRVHGRADAPLTIIEYASLTCSACAAFQARVIPPLTRDYIDTGKVKLVFRDFPLDPIARMAAACAHCVTGDSYFAFIDLLFKNQQEWTRDFDQNGALTREDIEEGLVRMGRVAGMSREQVMACSSDPTNLALVDASFAEGQERYKIPATPSFIIDGIFHPGGMSYDALKKILDELPTS